MDMLIGIFNQIGYAGVALVIVACLGVYISLRTFIYLHFVWKGFKKDFLDKDCVDKECVESACENSRNPLISIIYDIIHIHGKHSEDIRAEVAYLFHRNFEHVSKSLSWIRLISAMSPLLGLLGTVLGMVSVFQTISDSGSPNSAQLAGGIWEALITTVMGLSIAIPMLVFYYYLMLKFRAFHIEAVEHSYRALEICAESPRHQPCRECC